MILPRRITVSSTRMEEPSGLAEEAATERFALAGSVDKSWVATGPGTSGPRSRVILESISFPELVEASPRGMPAPGYHEMVLRAATGTQPREPDVFGSMRTHHAGLGR